MFARLIQTGRALPLTLILSSAALAQNAAPGGHFIQNWDLDGDGTVTLTEAREKRADVFTMFDQNENGQLDAPEYDLFDETRAADRANNAGEHAKGAMANADEGMARELNDTDGDGIVTKTEFETGSDAWFARMDRTGDGKITGEDFGGGNGMGQGQGQGQGKGQGQGMGKTKIDG